MKIQKLSKICAAVTCALTLSASWSANAIEAINTLDAASISKGYSSDNINQVLGLSGDTQMKTVKEVKLSNGVSKVRFQQTYQGIPVFGYSVAATKTAMGLLTNVQGKILDLKGKHLSTKVRIPAEKAMQMMLDNDKVLGKGASKTAKDTVYNRQNELFIYRLNDQPKLVHRISYVVPAKDGGSPSRPVFFVDAQTGETVYAYENTQHDLIGTGPGGNIKTGKYHYGTDFGYMDVTKSGSTCTMENENVIVYDMHGGTSGGTVVSFSCPDHNPTPINGAYSPENDALYFGNVIFDMYNDYVGAPPLAFQLCLRVHYSSNYENAFWDGSCMSFGDGQNTFYPLVSLDVTAHEVSHGFTEQNAALVYANQSGGINEAFSDMAGEAAEYHMNGINDWMVGEQVFKASGALRYMDDPTQDGASIGHASDYSSSMDVHHSSGVYNKAFYTLANTAGWNTQKAFKVMALANQTYWTANSTFDEGACGVESAAGDLGYTVSDVTAAFAAVGVSCVTIDPTSELKKGVATTISGATGSETAFTYTTPVNVREVLFNLSGGSGDADMYVKFGSAPTTSDYDCRPYLSGNAETCDFRSAQAGTYHVMVKGYRTYSGVSLVADHELLWTQSGTVNNIDVATGEFKFWHLELSPEAFYLDVSISGGTGDADLYVRAGAQPTPSNYDCRPYATGNSENCHIDTLSDSNYHIGIRGYSAAIGVTMDWSFISSVPVDAGQ